MRTCEYKLTDDCGRFVIKTYHSSLTPCTRAYRAHHHTECELSLFLRGSGTYTVGEKTYPFAAGDIFLFGSNETHSITEIAADMEVLNVHFEPRILWEHADTAELLSLFTSRKKNFENRFLDAQGDLGAEILSLEREISERRACYTVTAKYRLFACLAEIIRRYDCVRPLQTPTASSAQAKNLRRAIDYIGENLDQPLTLAALADVAYMSPTYFSAVFKRLNGISPWEYITIKRVERAIEMLKTTDMTKLEIAERCGFSGASNFYKMFFRITGKRPSDFSRRGE
ncbi:MAG: helix-turn-helix domain-containing protein [Clostridia bacterium]|nr:helix-turn-helix domain-containing protein [Clostridia bacterium]